ncbi:helix-hairpin-helix domain-containing protein [Cytophagaceae bacterium ABcell3]|nr:helix-hairpin-helix domain-containing protein [Cytophagaceae bacterium ABcell3]
MKVKVLILILLLFIHPPVLSQTSLEDFDIDAFILNIFGNQNEDLDYEILYESLYQYYLNPLDINTAQREELASLFILKEYQLNNFILYREKLGPFLEIYELQAVPGLDIRTIKQLLPFITVQGSLKNSFKGLAKRMSEFDNSYFLIMNSRTLEHQRGYIKNEEGISAYTGSPWRTVSRFRNSRPGDFSMGFTLEKDPGEPFKWDPSGNWYGFDFISYHFAIFNKGKIKSLCIGDFQHQFGQGLTLSSGFNIGKGGETVLTARRSNLGLRPHSSVQEFGFFRGISTTIETGPVDLTVFYSNQFVNGRLRDSEEGSYIQTISTSGFHRTMTEKANRKTVQEKAYGGNVSWKNKSQRLHIGATAVANHYSVPIKRDAAPFRAHEFNGTENFVASMDYRYLIQNFNFFGEIAKSASGGTGTIQGMIASLTPKIDFSMVGRRYEENFHSFYGNAFGENTRNINEIGMYWGMSWRPFQEWTFSAFYDHFRFPWMRYLVNSPSGGHEYFLRAEFKPSKQASLLIQYRSETKDRNLHNNDLYHVNAPAPVLRSNFLINADFNPNAVLHLRSRVQVSRYEQLDYISQGYAIIQDFNLNLHKVRFSSRFAVFDTDDFNSRLYVFERNVLYAFSFPAYHGRGVRKYLMSRIRLWKNNDLWIRYARTLYRDRNRISSGLQQIEGNRRTDITVQFIYNF